MLVSKANGDRPPAQGLQCSGMSPTGVLMRFGVAVVAVLAACSGAHAFDTSVLPPTCQSTLAEMKTDKARFAALGSQMQKYRKASDTENFCRAAKATIMIIKEQSDKIDACVGDVSSDKMMPAAAIDQMTRLRTMYKQMLDAAKDPQNDTVHCGLADL